MTMKIAITAASIAAAGCFAAASAAQAGPLTIVEVGAPAVNCAFNNASAPNCTVVVEDSVGTFTLPGDNGNARLQSRTYPGAAGAPAAGDMAYVYRVDLTNVQGLTAANCVPAFTINFPGGVVPLPYRLSTPNDKFDVFVVTSGGLGTVALKSAVQTGVKIVFTFTTPVCPGATSYFFGLASKSVKPVADAAQVSFSLGGGATPADRVP
jgi:hypothetical protein